jgi:hypothetical protein
MRDDNLAVTRLWRAKAASDDIVLPRGKRSIFTVGNAATGNDDVRALLGKASGVALPIPEVPPVITTILFSNVAIVGV